MKSVCSLIGLRNNKLHCKCNECNKRWLTPISRLIKKFPNTYEFCNNNINKFDLLVEKGVYPYEYMDSWERFDETLPDKKAFHSKLYLKEITDKDYIHVQKVFEEFNIKHLGEYYNCIFKVIHYCLQKCLKTSEINVLKYVNFILFIFYQHLD